MGPSLVVSSDSCLTFVAKLFMCFGGNAMLHVCVGQELSHALVCKRKIRV